ncbi:MAG: hypothetical protein ACXWB0_02015 [Sulfuricurvum sp.]
MNNNWLLVYQLTRETNSITFIRLGSHAQIFRKFK